ncbi:MAG: acyltransferase [Muribaculaceae bacterium]|nr:acyltransferase [Muribaculaceae bacterium]
MIPQEYQDIAPYDSDIFAERLRSLVKEPGFEHAVRYVMPDVDYPAFCRELLSVDSQYEFQHKVMLPFLEMLVAKTTDGVFARGFDTLSHDKAVTFITNHRDIVLDASFLNWCLLKDGFPTCEIAIGNNLLIFNWIEDLVRINKSFIVKRNLKLTKALEAARQLSGYMHYCIEEKHVSTWIAQREGRAKDSNDLTQESLLKMLALGGNGSPIENIKSLNITPTSISYEYDPCDFLKATEYLNRRRDPDFHKSEHDDLLSMETGILGYKGRVYFTVGECINDKLDALDPELDRQTVFHEIAAIIDKTIHRGYYLFPCNYIAYDYLEKSRRFADKYTEKDVEDFRQYIDRQLDKVRIHDVTEEERQFMKNMVLGMYAFPLHNALAATAEQ